MTLLDVYEMVAPAVRDSLYDIFQQVTNITERDC